MSRYMASDTEFKRRLAAVVHHLNPHFNKEGFSLSERKWAR